MVTWPFLPSDVKIFIFSFLSPQELGSVCIISKEFKVLAENPRLWEYMWNRDKKEWRTIENSVTSR
jgi:hypothetical protein